MKTMVLAAAATAIVALVAPGLAHADAVTDWNAHASTVIADVAGQASHPSTVGFAKVQGAVYDAVNGIARTHTPYLVLPQANPWDSQDAAAATAAYRVLRALFPGQGAFLDARYAESLATIPDGPMEAGGIAAGEAAAAAMLAARTGDGFGGPPVWTIGIEPGRWRPTPPANGIEGASWLGNVKPFLMRSGDQFRSDGPLALGSGEYAEEYAEVAELGSAASTTRTPDQTDAAFFWQDQVPRMWNRAVRRLSAEQGLDIVQNARLFAMTSLAAADGAIGCWNDKYHWNSWRPITAIRDGANDGNTATEGDPGWTPLMATPAFPEHPSGHGCVSGATVLALESFLGTDKVAITVDTNAAAAIKKHRSFERLSHSLKEVIGARVWAGMHFRHADVAGTVIGRKVVHWMDKHYFQPVR